MRRGRLAAALVLPAVLGLCLPILGEVVVLRGGVRITLKQPWVRQGNNAILTRADGTILSVAISEIDRKATAAAQAAPAPAPPPAIVAPPATPAEAARLTRTGPKARVRVTDSDVAHWGQAQGGAAEGGDKADKKEGESRGGARLEIADYSQDRDVGNLIVRGTMRNVGSTTAVNARLTVSALDESGAGIGSVVAEVSHSQIESGLSASFTAVIPVGEKITASLRFSPQWIAAAPPVPAGASAAAAAPSASGGAAGGASGAGAAGAMGGPPRASAEKAPGPVPTPFGQGVLYAAPPPSVPSTAPADGKTGYLPGASNSDNQPKPPQ